MHRILLMLTAFLYAGFNVLAGERTVLPPGPSNGHFLSSVDDCVEARNAFSTENLTQGATVSGTVTAIDTGEELPGVNILIKGTTTGTVTDSDGNYSLEVPDPENAVLIFTFVGYMPMEEEVLGRSRIDVQMTFDISYLTEVVVVGYGTQDKRHLTGAISSVKAEKITQNINADPVTSLQGNTAGVQVTQASGQPGGAIRVRVRGSASLLSGGDPLVVVDGIPIITSTFGSNPNDGISGLSEINPNDIESMEVLKDGAAAAIYGSRAANGVILITTKKGSSGKGNVTINLETGMTSPTNRVDLLSGPDLMAVNRRAWENTAYSGTGSEQYFPIPQDVDGYQGFNEEIAAQTDVDWMDQVLRDGQFRNFNLSASTGAQKTSALVSFGFRDEEGIEIGRDFTRANARLNVDHRAGEKLNIGMNMSLAYVERVNPGGHFGTAQSSALPFFPINRPDDETKLFNGFNENSNDTGTNPIFFRNNFSDVTKTYRTISNIFADYEVIPGLRLRTEWGIDFQSNVSDSKMSQELFPPNANDSKVGGNGKTETRRFSSIAWNVNNTITYSKAFDGGHNFTALLGNSVLNQDNEGQTFIFEGLTFPSLPIANVYERTSNTQTQFRFVSFFTRLDYNFKGKYFVQASVRGDGSSRFGAGNRSGEFGGGSVGWAFSEENFFENVGLIDFGKLRASYGTVGNAELPTDFLSLSLANVNDSEIGYAQFRGVAFERIGNENLSWETTTQFNVGLDLSMLNNRMDITLDYYNKLSDDLLLESRLANSTGYLNRNYVFNVGSVRNNGIEFGISTTNIQTSDFRWTSSFNISHNKGVIEQLTPPVNAEDTKIKTFNTGSVQLVEGGNFGSYFLPVWAGVDPTTGNELIYEVDQIFLEETGITRFTGNVLDAEVLGGDIDRHRMVLQDKTSVPDFFGGFSNTFSYKGLTLDVLFYFQGGNYVLDEGERNQSYPREQQSLRADLRGALNLPEGEFSNTTPLTYNSEIRGVSTTRFLHDASFIRLRNVRISYDFADLIDPSWGLTGLQLYAAGQNLLTWTKFPGWDPEVFSGGGDQQRANAGPGTIGYVLPQVRTLLVGLNIVF